MFPTQRHTHLSRRTTGTRNSCRIYRVRNIGKNAFVCTSNAYAHSTEESAGLECEGGERRRRLDTTLSAQSASDAVFQRKKVQTDQNRVAIAAPTTR